MRQLAQDTKGQAGTRSAIAIIVAIAVGIIVASVMIPVAINELESDDSVTLTQDSGTVYEVDAQLESTVTNVDGTNNDVTIELNDTRTGTTTSQTIAVGSTSTYTLEGGDVNVTVDSIDTTVTPSTATVTYEFAKDYSYSDGASAIWSVLGLIIVLAVFLYVIRLAVDKV